MTTNLFLRLSQFLDMETKLFSDLNPNVGLYENINIRNLDPKIQSHVQYEFFIKFKDLQKIIIQKKSYLHSAFYGA